MTDDFNGKGVNIEGDDQGSTWRLQVTIAINNNNNNSTTVGYAVVYGNLSQLAQMLFLIQFCF
jgi:hypothetical protein